MSHHSVHTDFAWVVVGLNAVAGFWALAANWVEPLRRRALWWLVTAAYVSVGIQVTLGALAQQQEGLEPKQFHVFYGFVSLAAVGIIYSYRSQLPAHQKYLLFGLGSLFVMGLALRAIYLAG